MAAKGNFALETIFTATDKISSPLGKIQTKLGAFGKSAKGALQTANSAIDQGIRGIGKFADVIGIGAIASVAGLGFAITDTMKKGIDFEASLIRAGAALDVPVRKGTKGFALLEDAAMKVGATTEHGSLKAAVALNDLATAGYTAEQSMGAVFKIADFASAGTLELGAATEIASGTLASFGLRVTDAAQNTQNMGRVMDSLVKAANDSNASVSELYETVKTGGATASGAGAKIEEFLGAANVLAASGLKGEKAGTGLANVFLRLSKQTPIAAKEMQRYGLHVEKSKNGSIDMVGTLSSFDKGLAKLGKSQKVAAITTIFGESAGNAYLKLIAAGPAKLKAYTDSLQLAAGKTSELAELNRKATGAQLEIFWNKLENLKLVAFKTLGPLIVQVADSVGKWVTENEKLINSTAAEWMTKLKDSLPEIWSGIKLASEGLAAFVAVAATVKTVSLVSTVIGGLSTAYTWLFVSTSAATGSTGALATVFNLLTGSTVRSTIATAASTVAQLASRAATALMTAATWAYKTPLDATLLSTIASRIATMASTVAQVASRAAILLGTAAQTAYAAVLSLSSGALGTFRIAAMASVPAIGAQVTALAPLLITLATATAAVGALMFAWDQYNKLSKELGGGVSGTIGKMWEMGTLDFTKASDAVMNETAKADRKKSDREAAPQIVTPAARVAQETVEANAKASVDGTITVKAEKGTKANVKTKPHSLPIRTAQSGGF